MSLLLLLLVLLDFVHALPVGLAALAELALVAAKGDRIS